MAGEPMTGGLITDGLVTDGLVTDGLTAGVVVTGEVVIGEAIPKIPNGDDGVSPIRPLRVGGRAVHSCHTPGVRGVGSEV